MKTISQREARRLKKRVAEFERIEGERSNRYRSEYPGGANIVSFDNLSDYARGALESVCRLKCALVAKFSANEKLLRIYAVPPK